MALSALDLFTIGIGPSSSHTIGPMRAARHFASVVVDSRYGASTDRVQVELYGSLGSTGRGHGTDGAVVAGLNGYAPEAVSPEEIQQELRAVEESGTLALLGSTRVHFEPPQDLSFLGGETLSRHPNGMRFVALSADDTPLIARTYFSVGGGSVVDAAGHPLDRRPHGELPHPFRTGADLLRACERIDADMAAVVLANESAFRPEAETFAGLDAVAAAMRDCIDHGCAADGILPGGLQVPRRAPGLRAQMIARADDPDRLDQVDWVTLFAIAVNEENAAGGRVVTAPTSGAAGVVPAVLEYYRRFVPGADDDGVRRFLLTAAAIGIVYKETASVSGAEVGCQGEIGSACSMAAAALTAVSGGSVHQVENAAEIAMEHNLGLTCDPIGGLVQVPCIERNAVGAVKAITASRLALRGDGDHLVSLDQVISTMRDTGADMHTKYKETSLGGLAVNIVEC